MIRISRSERSALIRLAHSSPRGSSERRNLLRFLKKARTYDEYLEDKKSRNEEPLSEEDWKSRHEHKDEGGSETKDEGKVETKDEGSGSGFGKGLSKALSSWVSKAKGLTQSGKEALSKMGAGAHKFISDPQARSEMTSSVAETIKKAPEKIAERVHEHFKHELHEVGGGVKKIMAGQLPSKKEGKAIASLAVEIAAAATTISTAGTLGAAAFFTKSMIKHIALSIINPRLGDLHVMQEAGHVGHSLGHLFDFGAAAVHHANSRPLRRRRAAESISDDAASSAFVNFVVSAVAKKMKDGIPEDEIVGMLNGVAPPVASEKVKSEG